MNHQTKALEALKKIEGIYDFGLAISKEEWAELRGIITALESEADEVAEPVALTDERFAMQHVSLVNEVAAFRMALQQAMHDMAAMALEVELGFEPPKVLVDALIDKCKPNSPLGRLKAVLYTRPPAPEELKDAARKPLTDAVISDESGKWVNQPDHISSPDPFKAGVRWAEKQHGITDAAPSQGDQP